MAEPATSSNRSSATRFALLVSLFCILLTTILWQRGGTLTVDVGTRADRYVVQGFHKPEENLTDTGEWYTYRWSEPQAAVTLPAHYLPGIVEIRGALLTDGTAVALDIGETTRIDLPADARMGAVQRFTFLWPAETDPLGYATIHIDARPPDQNVEKRSLGMLVSSVAVRSIQGPFHAPPLVALVILGAIPLLLSPCLRLCGIDPLVSVAGSLLVGTAAVVIWDMRPFWLQQFLPHCFFALLALAGLFWWMRSVAALPAAHPASSEVAGVVRLPVLLLIFVAASGLIPLYLLIKYGIALGANLVNLPIAAMGAALLLPLMMTASSAARAYSAGRSWRSLAAQLLIGIIVASLLIYGIDRYAGAVTKGYATDFTAMFRGVSAFIQGGSLYNFEHLATNHLGDTYKYPPFFVFLMAWITSYHYDIAIQLWHLFNLALLIGAVWLLWRWSGQPLRSWSTLGLLYVVLAFKPLVDTLGQGQIDIIILFGLSATLLMLGQGRWSVWGALLAFPAMVKLYPAYLLIHGVALRCWRSVAAFAAACLLLGALSIVVFGWTVHATFLFDVLPSIGGGTAWAENQTLNGFLNRLVVDEIALKPDNAPVVRGLTIVGVLGFSLWTWQRVQRMTPMAGFGLWIITMLIIVPIAWMHYMAILLIPWYQLFVRLDSTGEPGQHGLPWRSLLLYTLAWMLLCYGNQWTFFDRTFHGPLWALLLSYKFYGLLLFWFALAFDPTAQAGKKECSVTSPTQPA